MSKLPYENNYLTRIKKKDTHSEQKANGVIKFV